MKRWSDIKAHRLNPRKSLLYRPGIDNPLPCLHHTYPLEQPRPNNLQQKLPLTKRHKRPAWAEAIPYKHHTPRPDLLYEQNRKGNHIGRCRNYTPYSRPHNNIQDRQWSLPVHYYRMPGR
jgi:hypothetical protein